MENIPSEIRPLSNPSSFRQANPAVLPPPPVSEKARLQRRRRLFVGFAIAAALHLGLVLVWWLTPPERLKASYSPERWVQVLPVAKQEAPKTAEEPQKPAASTKKLRKAQRATASDKPKTEFQ